MNVQAQLSGQISGQAPNQLAQQNGVVNLVPGGIGPRGASGGVPNNVFMDQNLQRIRLFMRERIYGIITQRQVQPVPDQQKQKFHNLCCRLEDGLFKLASNKEEYMNLNTLESRLSNLIKLTHNSGNNQRPIQHLNPSPSVGTMIPTPGMSNSGNFNGAVSSIDTMMVTSSGLENIAPTAMNAGSLMPSNGIHVGSIGRSNGAPANGYRQPPSDFSISSGGNMASMGDQRMMTQMIPTPGFNNSINNNNSNNNNDHNNQSYTNVETSNGVGGYSSSHESSILLQPQQQKQYVGGQNSYIMQNLGGQMGAGIRSGLQGNSYGFPNGSVNGGLEIMPNNQQVSSEPTQQHYDQYQQTILGDGCVMMNAEPFGSGNFYEPVTSVGLMKNAQRVGSMNFESMLKTSSSSVNSKLIPPRTQQAAHVRQQSVHQQENWSFQSQQFSRDDSIQHSQQQQLLQHSNQLQSTQFVREQSLQIQQPRQRQHMLNSDVLFQSGMPNPTTGVKCEPGVEQHAAVLLPQISGQYMVPELQNQFQQNAVADCSVGMENISNVPVENDNFQSQAQMPKLLQQTLDSKQLVSETHDGFQNYSVEMLSDPAIKGQWNTRLQDRSSTPGSMLQGKNVQEDFHQRISGQGEAIHNNLASEESLNGLPGGAFKPQKGTTCGFRNLNRNQEFRDQQRWLLFLFHVRRCKNLEGKCPYVHCTTGKHLLRHTDGCSTSPCQYPRCQSTRSLVTHYKNCSDAICPVCIPVKNYIQQQVVSLMKARAHPSSDSGVPTTFENTWDDSATYILKTSSGVESALERQPSRKRMKIEQISEAMKPDTESSAVTVSVPHDCHVTSAAQQQHGEIADVTMGVKSESMEMNFEIPASSSKGSPNINVMDEDHMDNGGTQLSDGECAVHDKSSGSTSQRSIEFEKEKDPVKQENGEQQTDQATVTKSGKPTIKGVSMIELFTPEQVGEHIRGLRQWVGQSKAKAEKNQAMEQSMSENSCQLCAVEKLTFEPPPIYCSPCGARIKRNAMYYTVGAGEGRHYFCIPCYNESRGETITVDGTSILKAKLEKKKNDEETEEGWVQCDKCEAWQHQICALFNGRRNDGGQAEYTCPNCYTAEVERGERMPLPQSAVLGAKDLPKSILSDHIEQRLFRKLKQEREDRARLQGKSFDEVPGAEALVVRVVSSVDKKLEVKQRFYEIFKEENYPTEFPYKSKVILLFQKIEGVEVCLFGMYVQEFGSESQFPNQRRVYLSYLDSVKYFRPEIKAVTGEALRTFVYHEILIGYLEYCKMRGFTSCYIWACPPLKGEDYILYCHPEIQKTPKSDKLREWYLSMLRKATKEHIVAELTNFYDHFFVSTGECKAKVTAARLPYFDGDYWPGAAEDLINQLNQEEDGRKQNKKGTTKKTITKRALKASGQSDLSGNASKDLLLMHKLGETISPMKEDFIMVHLQHCCTHCCILMVSGNRWVCKQCKNFQICDKCFEVEQKREERERHPVNHRDKHVLYPEKITDVPADTKDKDEIVESEFFDTRQAFLSLCQGNHYQYDTLRRAKHSSMMVLYHLHNPTAPAFVITCNVCQVDIEAGQGWRCEICPEYDICNSCFQKGGINHPHKLTNHPSTTDRDAQNKEARQMRVAQLRSMLDLLVHASQCRSKPCLYPHCRKVKALFRHGFTCKTRASGGCVLCRRMWYLLQIHARACKEPNCQVPRCRDLKEHVRRMQQQSDSRRRAAVMEMMRQRAAEVAGNSG